MPELIFPPGKGHPNIKTLYFFNTCVLKFIIRILIYDFSLYILDIVKMKVRMPYG